MNNNNNTQEKRIFAHEVATELTEKEMKATSGGSVGGGAFSFPWASAEERELENKA